MWVKDVMLFKIITILSSINFVSTFETPKLIKPKHVLATLLSPLSTLTTPWIQPSQREIKPIASFSQSLLKQRSPMFNSRTIPRKDTIPATNSESSSSSRSSSFIRDAVRNVGPSVVRVDCEREVPLLLNFLSPDSAPQHPKETDVMRVSGSGFIVSTDGYILTNAHVVNQAKKITVTLSNGRTFKAAMISCDELTDLAVLKAESGNYALTSAVLGDSSKLHSGDWLIAVGCPVGLDFTVTLGIVSCPKRSALEVGAPHLKGSYIQTDAALNSGNSGGPLINDRGEVVGINTMVRSNTEAIGFAIPINRAKEAFAILKEGKRPTHAYFGLDLISLTPDNARINNDDPNAVRLPVTHGAMVTKVSPTSPSAASFRKYDVIVEVNGHPIHDMNEADYYLDKCKIDTNANFKVIRGVSGETHEINCAPKDLYAIIEEKKLKRIVEFFRP